VLGAAVLAAALLTACGGDELASARVRDALEGIEDHASEVCDIDFAG
jgi:hypothetical protein